ncbi:uncharacterized protein [Choristoneura fumiferana]|uniref:uncharacterized protein n=1 Tax=Choristoneura fumiferana TaxID=7141 RepID=UPI003D15AC73
MSVGKLEAFDIHKGSWETYKDRLEQYFIVNDVKDDRKVPLLITLIGAEGYELLVTLCTPEKPANVTYSVIVKLLADHLQPKPSVLAERYKFRQRKQGRNESIAEYVADLKKLSRFCDFGSWLDESIRDQLVCGLYNESIRLRLFSEQDLKMKKACALAVAMEAAEINAAAVEDRGHKSVDDVRGGTTTSCYAVSSAIGASSTSRGRMRGRSFGSRVGSTRGDGARPGPSHSEGLRTAAFHEYRNNPSAQRWSNGGASAATKTTTDSRKMGHAQLQCLACGRDHATATCKFTLYTCRVCNQEGHLKKMCPRWSSVVKHNYVEDSVNQPSEEDDLERSVGSLLTGAAADTDHGCEQRGLGGRDLSRVAGRHGARHSIRFPGIEQSRTSLFTNRERSFGNHIRSKEIPSILIWSSICAKNRS